MVSHPHRHGKPPVKNQNIPIYHIDIQGVRGNGFLRKALAPFKIMKATFSAMKFMKQLQVDAVAGFGGYVAGPVVWPRVS